MKVYKILSLLVLLSLMVSLPAPNATQQVSMAAQPLAPTTVFTQPAEQIVVPSGLGEWQSGPFPPSGFQYARHDGAFVPGPDGEPWANKVYFLGGRTSPSTEAPDIWMFNPANGIYTDTLVNVVEDVSNYNANLIMEDGTGRGPAIYVIGGTDKDHGGVTIGTVQRYYPQTNEAEALPQIDNFNGMVGGYRVAAVGTAVVDDIIYVFGGWETNMSPYFSSETWMFDPTAPSGSRWTNLLRPLHTARSYIMSAVQDGKVYAIGGVGIYAGGELDPVDTMEVLDTANVLAGWTLLTPMPAPGGEGRAYGFDSDTLSINSPWQGKIYVVAPNDWAFVSSEVLIYDVATDTWRDDLPELPTARADLAGTFVPLCTSDPNDGLPGLWTFGGRVNESCDPPLGPTEYYSLPCAGECFGVTDVTVSGPVELLEGEVGLYTAITQPPDATSPVSLLWSNGIKDTQSTYSWPEQGTYTVIITSTNCVGSAVVTDTLEVVVSAPCTDLTGVEIDGPVDLLVGETGLYSVTLTPQDATPPIDILWSNGITDTQAMYSWIEPGIYTVTVTASNCSGTTVSDILEVVVSEPPCTGLTGAEIDGPANLLVGEAGQYSATLAPPDADPPMDILWSNGITDTQATYSWIEPGTYSVTVMASNCGGTAIVTDTLEVTVSVPPCMGLSEVEIEGPLDLIVGEIGQYSVALTPPGADTPIDILWSNGITDTQATYSWIEPGSYSVSVTASNCGGTAVVTDTLEVTVSEPPCTILTGAEIDGPTSLNAGEAGLFSVTFAPPGADLPIDVLWNNGMTETEATYSWIEPGFYSITVTASNCGGTEVTAIWEVEVVQPVYAMWLPLIVRSEVP